jgi:MFS transporter, DHA1 family, staphyloferrin A biosynthesis exporter
VIAALGRWFPALAEGPVRWYLAGQLVAVHGTFILDITLNLLAWQLSASPAVLGTLNFLLYGPGLVVMPMMSWRLHRGNARQRTLAVLYGSVTVAVLLWGLNVGGWLSVPIMLVLAAIKGAFNGMEIPPRHMLIASIVEENHRLPNALAMNTVVFQVARMVGPALAAGLFATVGATWGFFVSALALLFLAFSIAQASARVSNPSLWSQPSETAPAGGLRAAFAYARADRFGSLFLPVSAALALFGVTYQTLIPVLADQVYGNTQRWTAGFFAAAGGGALVAALLLSSRWMLKVMQTVQALAPWGVALALAGLGWVPVLAVSLVCFVVIGFGVTFVSTATNAYLQQRLPPHLRGGMIALYLTSFNAMVPFGQMVAGALAERGGAPLAYQVSSLALMGCLVLLYVPRWIARRRLEFDATKL